MKMVLSVADTNVRISTNVFEGDCRLDVALKVNHRGTDGKKGETMPAMPRFSKKGTKIAFKILGTPENILFRRKGKENKVDRQLLFQETTRIR